MSSSFSGAWATGLALAATVGYLATPRSAPKPKRVSTSGQAITIFSANAYLIPWFYVYKLVLEGDKFAIDSCKDQHDRAARLADLAKEHDVLAIQEIWGGATDVLQSHLEQTHEIIPRYRGWRGVFGTGLLADYSNTLTAHLRSLGGLWFASCPSSTRIVWSLHHTFKHNLGEEFMNKSASFVLLDVSPKWGEGKKLLVVNTHLHSPEPFANTKDRAAQRSEMLAILASLPQKLKREGIDVVWSECGGILVGDLNTAFCKQGDKSGQKRTAEYLVTLKEFDAVDLYLQNDGFKEEMIGKFSYDGEANEYVSAVSRKDSSRMDYALALNSLGEGGVPLMKLRATKCEIMDDKSKEPCSDHWPISVALVPQSV